MNPFEWLQDWYAGQCNGDWEHDWGVRMGTLDNPGWRVSINLEWTDYKDVAMPRYQEDAAGMEGEWITCWIEKNIFHGAGGPFKLGAIIAKFQELVAASGITIPASELAERRAYWGEYGPNRFATAEEIPKGHVE